MFHRDEIIGFKKGIKEMEDRKRDLIDDLMKALKIKTTSQLYNYRRGQTRLTNPQVLAVTQVFQKYGIYDPFDMIENEKVEAGD